MPVCATCGAPLTPSGSCEYAVPLDSAPSIGNPAMLATGRQSHADHELHIARWRVHHADEKGGTPEVMAWARARLAREGHTVPPT